MKITGITGDEFLVSMTVGEVCSLTGEARLSEQGCYSFVPARGAIGRTFDVTAALDRVARVRCAAAELRRAAEVLRGMATVMEAVHVLSDPPQEETR